MKTPTNAFILLPRLSQFSREWFRVILFLAGIMSSLCFAHPPSDTESSLGKIDSKITTATKTKIFIVEGTITSNLENTNAAEIISIPIQKKIKVENSPKQKAKKENPKVVKKDRKQVEEQKKSLIQSLPVKELISSGSKNIIGIYSSNTFLKKIHSYLYLNKYQEFNIPFYTSNYKYLSEDLISYLFFCKQITRPPPYVAYSA